VEGFVLDKSISSNTSKVYIHPSGRVVVTHQGTTTALDWEIIQFLRQQVI
jgi:hypothetical protein